MAKVQQNPKTWQEVNRLYDDLDQYLEFCKKQGYVFDESHLYNEKTPWGEFQRVLNGKFPKDNWSPYPKEKRDYSQNAGRPRTHFHTR